MQKEMSRVRLDEMRGAPVHDLEGSKIGTVEEIFYDHQTRRPEWVGIGTGFFGTKRVLVPVQGARVTDDGLLVAYSKDQVKDSPEIDEDEISQQCESELMTHYGLRSTGTEAGTGGRATGQTTSSDRDESVTRAEEEIEVGKRSTEVGSARLRKWVETEPVALDVELQREVARVTREPINQPVSDHDFSEEEVEVPLHAEKPVVQKQTVAKERVGLEKDVETDTQTIEDEVKKERVEVEGDVSSRRK
jgi:uncharacterized protein (TIGR02271 family)